MAHTHTRLHWRYIKLCMINSPERERERDMNSSSPSPSHTQHTSILIEFFLFTVLTHRFVTNLVASMRYATWTTRRCATVIGFASSPSPSCWTRMSIWWVASFVARWSMNASRVSHPTKRLSSFMISRISITHFFTPSIRRCSPPHPFFAPIIMLSFVDKLCKVSLCLSIETAQTVKIDAT